MDSEFLLILVCLYGALLFVVAWLAERYGGWLSKSWWRPLVYALAIGVFCSSWTFLGAVGQAVESGWLYLPIYLGPILLFIFGWSFLRRLLIISSRNKVTSIADFIGSRYGKNQQLAAVVTMVVVVGTLPYIALQLRGVEIAWNSIQWHSIEQPVNRYGSSLVVAMVMAWFAILFGTRISEGRDRLRGVLTAIATESLVKLCAFVVVGALAIYLLMSDGVPAEVSTHSFRWQQLVSPVFFTELLLAATAIVCLPRQFHVMVVEYHQGRDLRFARWLIPVYLGLFALLVVPLSQVGAALNAGNGIDPDSYVLSLPQWAGQEGILALSFIGAVSAATGMVVMATIALSIMISNELIVPWWLRYRTGANRHHQGLAYYLRNIRRFSIVTVLLLSWLLDLVMRQAEGLASMGLVSFAATAQLMPAVVGALYWNRGHARGVMAGLLVGMLMWAYCLLLPQLINFPLWVQAGPWGIAWLSPHNLLGMGWLDPLTHGVFWSLLLNTLVFIKVSRSTRPSLMDERQAHVFTRLRWRRGEELDREPSNIEVQQLQQMMAPLLGEERSAEIWRDFEQLMGHRLLPHDFTPRFAVQIVERTLAAIIGSVSAHKAIQLLAQHKPLQIQDFVTLVGGSSRQIQFSQNLLQTTLETIPQGISVVDGDLKLVAWNQHYQQIFNYPKRLLYVGCAIEKIYHYNAMRGILADEDRTVEEAVAKRLMQLRLGMPYRFKRTLPNKHVIEIQGTPLSNGGYVTTYTDISDYEAVLKELQHAKETLEERVVQRTEELSLANQNLQRENQLRARVEQELKQVNASKNRFFAAASHDLLQPVNAARLFVASLQEKLRRQHNQLLQRDTDRLDQALHQTEKLISSLREMSRLSSGKELPQRSHFAVKDLLKALAEEAEVLARAKGLTFRWVNSSQWVFSDNHLLRRVIQNFISNALRYTQHGKVLLGCRRKGRQLVIEVWDSGPGIAERDRGKIFEEFERLPGSNQGNQGLGLGLSIALRISQLLSHQLSLDSVERKGSVFRIAVPLGEVQHQPEHRYVAADSQLQGVSILCVDNDKNILAGMQSLLEQWGCEVVTAANLGEALSLWNRGRTPDIALLDFHLDKETGIDVYEALCLHWNSRIPAIVITADTDEHIVAHIRDTGCDYLAKPLKPAVLRNMLKKALRSDQLINE